MCTVTYIPQSEDSFILTSNRDEAPARSPQHITEMELAGQQLAFPRDEAAGGTWIAISNAGRLVCILNGAFEKHDRRPSYRRSRGLMALDLFEYPNLEQFIAEFIFEGMEPFTMLAWENGKLLDFRWDEKEKHLQWLDPAQKYIWSSAPLYPQAVRQKR